MKYFLTMRVFVGGVTSLALEMSATRLLCAYFSTSLYIWSCLTGILQIYPTIGYFIGRRLADRYPSEQVFGILTTMAAFSLFAIPIVCKPILSWSINAMAQISVSTSLSSSIGTILLFAIPVTLLGLISPFAIRLMTKDTRNSGSISGLLYAISTIGSLLGSFLPVLWLIPTIGVRRTVLLFGAKIDPAIVEVNHRYFDMNEPNLHVYIEDGRTFLATTHACYDVIAIDTFDQPYIPFQSTTHESFLQLHNQMTGPSTLVLNTVHTTHDYRPVQAFANTMKQVFPSVYTFNVPNSINTEITATKEPNSITTFQQNLASFSPTSTLGQVTNDALPVV